MLNLAPKCRAEFVLLTYNLRGTVGIFTIKKICKEGTCQHDLEKCAQVEEVTAKVLYQITGKSTIVTHGRLRVNKAVVLSITVIHAQFIMLYVIVSDVVFVMLIRDKPLNHPPPSSVFNHIPPCQFIISIRITQDKVIGVNYSPNLAPTALTQYLQTMSLVFYFKL